MCPVGLRSDSEQSEINPKKTAISGTEGAFPASTKRSASRLVD